MAQATHAGAFTHERVGVFAGSPAHQAYHIFQLGFVVAPIVAAVAIKPKVFAYVVSAWLLGIVVNLLLARNFYDIALRDVGLALGALALARLSHQFDPGALTTASARM